MRNGSGKTYSLGCEGAPKADPLAITRMGGCSRASGSLDVGGHKHRKRRPRRGNAVATA
jgi:hypothetical protein